MCLSETCGGIFPIEDGIPVLINEAASVFSVAGFRARKDTFFPSASRWKRRLLRILPSLSSNSQAHRRYEKIAAELLRQNPSPRLLVIGGSIEGVGSDALFCRKEIDFVDSDVAFGPRTKLICDAHDIPFDGETFDGVIVQAVLEHVVDPARCVSEICRVLKPSGLVYSETPFMQQVHGRQYDFTRFTLLGHRRLFRNFEEIDSGTACGPGMALAWSYEYFLLSFAKGPVARTALLLFALFTAFWLKYFDRWLLSRPGSLDAASSFYFMGRKSAKQLSDGELLAQYRGGF